MRIIINDRNNPIAKQNRTEDAKDVYRDVFILPSDAELTDLRVINTDPIKKQMEIIMFIK